MTASMLVGTTPYILRRLAITPRYVVPAHTKPPQLVNACSLCKSSDRPRQTVLLGILSSCKQSALVSTIAQFYSYAPPSMTPAYAKIVALLSTIHAAIIARSVYKRLLL